MKTRAFLAALALSVAANSASAETLLLNCRTIDHVNGDPYAWFKTPPKNVEELAKATWESGVAGFSVAPGTTWEISLTSGDIRDADEPTPRWTNADIKPASVTAQLHTLSGSIFYFWFNRINNKVTLERMLSEEGRQEWLRDHGKPFPSIIRFVQQCTVRTVP